MPRLPIAESVKSQVDHCYAELRRLIVSWQIAPGTRLTERELIARLGYGRTPVREALLRLDQDRLIDTMPRSGYRVRMLTRKSVQDFFAVWRSFAPLIAKLAVPRLTAEHKSALRSLGKERDRLHDGDFVGLSRIGGDFFNILIEAADNEPLTYVYSHLGAEMERIFQLYFQSADGRRWLGSGTEIASFPNVSSPETAYRLIEERVIASEAGCLTLLDG